MSGGGGGGDGRSVRKVCDNDTVGSDSSIALLRRSVDSIIIDCAIVSFTETKLLDVIAKAIEDDNFIATEDS
ncbi:unnamed protein product [Anisakis simplex]|uniref:Response regulatory domain-containing protein n=1 Tax=Anisakis simplex TaxID=6269 RepID=A0A0M3JN13_ANISI|nr:unnamed protein product [Anisakis simplex]